jgi:hypothetical protein
MCQLLAHLSLPVLTGLLLPLQGLIKAQWKSALPIAIAAIVFPFGIGAAVSPWLQVRHWGAGGGGGEWSTASGVS